MKRNIFLGNSGENKGITLIELVVAMMIFAIVMFSAVFVFKESLRRFRKAAGEKKVYCEATGVLNYIEKYISAAMCSDKNASPSIDFIGEKNIVRFVAPFYEGKQQESDLAKFAFYFIDDTVKVSVVRVSRSNPDFAFPESFSGAQTLGENISLFEMEYYDGSDWKSSWDTKEMEEPSLPESMKVSVRAYSEKIEGKRIEKTFTRTIKIVW